MNLRRVETEADLALVSDVRTRVYGDGAPITDADLAVESRRRYLWGPPGEAHGMLGLLPMAVFRGGVSLPALGVGGVGVPPEHRNSGAGSAMMRAAVREIRDRGAVVSLLAPFREPFYRRCGYASVGMRHTVRATGAHLPRFRDALPARRASRGEIEPVYREFAARRSAMLDRDAEWWDRRLPEGHRAVLYAFGDPVEGYVELLHDGSFWQEQSVEEVVWLTRRGYESALEFLAGLGQNKTTVRWIEGPDLPITDVLDQGITWESRPAMMYRLTDVPAALRTVRSETPVELSLTVADPLIAENRGPWRVAFGPEGTTVEPTSHGVEVTVEALTQAFFGLPSAADLLLRGALPPEAAPLARALPPLPATLFDFF